MPMSRKSLLMSIILSAILFTLCLDVTSIFAAKYNGRIIYSLSELIESGEVKIVSHTPPGYERAVRLSSINLEISLTDQARDEEIRFYIKAGTAIESSNRNEGRVIIRNFVQHTFPKRYSTGKRNFSSLKKFIPIYHENLGKYVPSSKSKLKLTKSTPATQLIFKDSRIQKVVKDNRMYGHTTMQYAIWHANGKVTKKRVQKNLGFSYKEFPEEFHEIAKASAIQAKKGSKELTENIKKEESALRNFIKLAKKGDHSAQRKLGYLYRYGSEIIDPSFTKSFMYFQQAAEQNDPQAQFELANLYYEQSAEPKLNLKERQKKGFSWMKRSADQGYVKAECAIGLIYMQGAGVTRSKELGFQWLNKAADHGDKSAVKYAKMYRNKPKFEKALLVFGVAALLTAAADQSGSNTPSGRWYDDNDLLWYEGKERERKTNQKLQQGLR